jgi:hypothetical protein
MCATGTLSHSVVRFERGSVLIQFVRISSRGDELPWFFSALSTGKTMMVHPVMATGPHLGRSMRIEGRGEPGQLSRVTSPWDAQWKGVSWAAAGFTRPHMGKGKAGQAGPIGWILAKEPISNKKFFFKSVL